MSFNQNGKVPHPLTISKYHCVVINNNIVKYLFSIALICLSLGFISIRPLVNKGFLKNYENKSIIKSFRKTGQEEFLSLKA